MNLSAINLSDGNFNQLSMNSRIEVAKFKPEPTFEKTIHEIKYNHLKIIASSAINLSAITSCDKNVKQISMNSRIEVEKFKPEPTFEKLLFRSKIIIWKVSPLLTWIYQLSLFLTIILKYLVWTTALKQKNSNLNQHLINTINEIKSNILKVSPKLIWMYQLSLQINPLNILKI